MSQKIEPHKITKPIQLLAVWFVGLILLVGTLLTGAAKITSIYWLPTFLSISAVVIIPIFLVFIFLLQTKFRPQMQADEYYYKYLDKEKNTEVIKVKKLQPPTEDVLILPELKSKKEILKEKTLELELKLSEIAEKFETNGNMANPSIQIEEAVKKVKDINKFADNSNLTIELNRTISHSAQILTSLINQGYGVNLFREKNDNPPEFKTISFGEKVHPKELSEILDLLPFTPEYIGIIDDWTRDRYYETIFIGSYSADKKVIRKSQKDSRSYRKHLKYTADTLADIKQMTTSLELNSYFKK